MDERTEICGKIMITPTGSVGQKELSASFSDILS